MLLMRRQTYDTEAPIVRVWLSSHAFQDRNLRYASPLTKYGPHSGAQCLICEIARDEMSDFIHYSAHPLHVLWLYATETRIHIPFNWKMLQDFALPTTNTQRAFASL